MLLVVVLVGPGGFPPSPPFGSSAVSGCATAPACCTGSSLGSRRSRCWRARGRARSCSASRPATWACSPSPSSVGPPGDSSLQRGEPQHRGRPHSYGTSSSRSKTTAGALVHRHVAVMSYVCSDSILACCPVGCLLQVCGVHGARPPATLLPRGARHVVHQPSRVLPRGAQSHRLPAAPTVLGSASPPPRMMVGPH